MPTATTSKNIAKSFSLAVTNPSAIRAHIGTQCPISKIFNNKYNLDLYPIESNVYNIKSNESNETDDTVKNNQYIIINLTNCIEEFSTILKRYTISSLKNA